jgi:hypothetical protein
MMYLCILKFTGETGMCQTGMCQICFLRNVPHIRNETKHVGDMF